MNIRRLLSLLGSLAVAASALHPLALRAADPHRAGRAEFYFFLQDWSADTSTIPNVTLPVGIGPGAPTATSNIVYDLDHTLMWGLGGGFNFNDYFHLRGEIQFGKPDYTMTWNNTKLTGEAWVNTGKVNADLNILGKKAFSPFVSGGIGYFYIDTGVPSGPPEYLIWWDYWWGPVATVSQPTFYKTYFSYNGAVGLRWDVNDAFALKFSYGYNWFDTSKAGSLRTTEISFTFSFKY